MKKIVLFLSLIFNISIISFAQQAFTVQGGYSWTMGMVGAEYQFGHNIIGAGIMPTTMPESGEYLTSFSAYYALSQAQYNESGFYTSIGFSSAAYRYQANYNGTSWTDSIVSPMGIANLGYKQQWNSGFNLKGEIGFGWCKYAKEFKCGITAGWVFKL